MREVGVFHKRIVTLNANLRYLCNRKPFPKYEPLKGTGFFSNCMFIARRFGEKNNISAAVHKDETSTYIHINVVPITSDIKLTSKKAKAARKNAFKK